MMRDDSDDYDNNDDYNDYDFEDNDDINDSLMDQIKMSLDDTSVNTNNHNQHQNHNQNHNNNHIQNRNQIMRQPQININKDTIIYKKYFSTEFICNSMYMSELSLRKMIKYESSDKVILPTNTITRFTENSNDNIYIIKLTNPKEHKFTFVGIGEFTAPDHIIYIPEWIKTILKVKNGDRIYTDALSVPKASYIKFKMCDELSNIINTMDESHKINIKAILEFTLQNHCVIFLDKKINIKMFDKEWYFTVVEMLPANIGSIVDSDVKFDLV